MRKVCWNKFHEKKHGLQQSTEDKREKIQALTLDNQDSQQQNALRKVNELTIAQVKYIFWMEGNAQYA
jgi:hypothetical protein